MGFRFTPKQCCTTVPPPPPIPCGGCPPYLGGAGSGQGAAPDVFNVRLEDFGPQFANLNICATCTFQGVFGNGVFGSGNVCWWSNAPDPTNFSSFTPTSSGPQGYRGHPQYPRVDIFIGTYNTASPVGADTYIGVVVWDAANAYIVTYGTFFNGPLNDYSTPPFNSYNYTGGGFNPSLGAASTKATSCDISSMTLPLVGDNEILCDTGGIDGGYIEFCDPPQPGLHNPCSLDLNSAYGMGYTVGPDCSTYNGQDQFPTAKSGRTGIGTCKISQDACPNICCTDYPGTAILFGHRAHDGTLMTDQINFFGDTEFGGNIYTDTFGGIRGKALPQIDNGNTVAGYVGWNSGHTTLTKAMPISQGNYCRFFCVTRTDSYNVPTAVDPTTASPNDCPDELENCYERYFEQGRGQLTGFPLFARVVEVQVIVGKNNGDDTTYLSANIGIFHGDDYDLGAGGCLTWLEFGTPFYSDGGFRPDKMNLDADPPEVPTTLTNCLIDIFNSSDWLKLRKVISGRTFKFDTTGSAGDSNLIYPGGYSHGGCATGLGEIFAPHNNATHPGYGFLNPFSPPIDPPGWSAHPASVPAVINWTTDYGLGIGACPLAGFGWKLMILDDRTLSRHGLTMQHDVVACATNRTLVQIENCCPVKPCPTPAPCSGECYAWIDHVADYVYDSLSGMCYHITGAGPDDCYYLDDGSNCPDGGPTICPPDEPCCPGECPDPDCVYTFINVQAEIGDCNACPLTCVTLTECCTGTTFQSWLANPEKFTASTYIVASDNNCYSVSDPVSAPGTGALLNIADVADDCPSCLVKIGCGCPQPIKSVHMQIPAYFIVAFDGSALCGSFNGADQDVYPNGLCRRITKCPGTGFSYEPPNDPTPVSPGPGGLGCLQSWSFYQDFLFTGDGHLNATLVWYGSLGGVIGPFNFRGVVDCTEFGGTGTSNTFHLDPGGGGAGGNYFCPGGTDAGMVITDQNAFDFPLPGPPDPWSVLTDGFDVWLNFRDCPDL